MRDTRGVSDASPEIAQLAELVRDADSVVALTGAGISVPSGIPDFRTPGTGTWTKVDPMKVAHIDSFRADPMRFWHFYGDRFQTLEDLDILGGITVRRAVCLGGRDAIEQIRHDGGDYRRACTPRKQDAVYLFV